MRDDRGSEASTRREHELAGRNISAGHDGDGTGKDDPKEAGAKDAGAARRDAEKGPDTDIDRWQDFSRDDARELADDPAPPRDAELPKGGQSRDGGLIENDG